MGKIFLTFNWPIAVAAHCQECLVGNAAFGAELYRKQVYFQILLDELAKTELYKDLDYVSDGVGRLYTWLGGIAFREEELEECGRFIEGFEELLRNMMVVLSLRDRVSRRFAEWVKSFEEFRKKYEPKPENPYSVEWMSEYLGGFFLGVSWDDELIYEPRKSAEEKGWEIAEECLKWFFEKNE